MLKRHTLLYLTESEMDFVWAHQQSAFPGLGQLQSKRRIFTGLPVIVRRERNLGSMLPVGISFPMWENGVRWRMASFVPRDRPYTRRVTPEQAAERCRNSDTVYGAFVREAMDAALKHSIILGLFGSVALSVITGLPYLHKRSDLDFVLTTQYGADLNGFAHSLDALEQKYGLHVDAEVALGDGYYGKLRELLYAQETILAKGDERPQLLLCKTVEKSLRIIL